MELNDIGKQIQTENGIVFTLYDGGLSNAVSSDNELADEIIITFGAWLSSIGIPIPPKEEWDDKIIAFLQVSFKSLYNALAPYGFTLDLEKSIDN